ncbi:MAG: NAD-dependent epimerase/dehydratase family protein [Acidobacteriota bacterium]
MTAPGPVLVTGGLGLVGRALVRRLVEEGREVTVIDHPSTGRPGVLDGLPGVTLVEGDIRRAGTFRRLGRRHWAGAYHLAAQANVAESVKDPVNDFEINAVGTLNVLEWARRHLRGPLVYPSTVAVYAPGASLPLREDALLGPSSPYGASKLAGEALVRAYGRAYGLSSVVVRLFNVYGEGMNKYVIHDLIRKLMRDPGRLEILGDGEQVRDYLHAEDAARALTLVAAKAPPGCVLNLGSGVPVRIKDLADRIIAAMGLSAVRKVYTGRSWAGDIQAWYADTSALEALGFHPRISLEAGLARVVADLGAAPHPETE